ncbi:MAG: RNA methyltransferase [Bdellovibrionales bacterium]|nr:RNA methyltransferase [Bdellovibrionales bacterium]
MKEITSSKNDIFKKLQSLLQSKGIKKHHEFLLSGEKIVCENTHLDATVIYHSKMDIPPAFSKNKSLCLSKELFKQLDENNTHFPLLLCSYAQFTPWRPQESSQDSYIFLPLGDPKNLGSAVRSCIAFGFKNIVLLKESSHPFHPKAIKSSSGAVLKACFFEGPGIHELVSEKKSPFLSLDTNGQSIRDFQWPAKFNLIVGEEGPGVPEKLKTISIQIPISSDVESLNAAHALSIGLFSASK